MKQTISLIISVILLAAIFTSCAPVAEDTAVFDEETDTEYIEEDETLTELDTSINAGLPIDSRNPKCCKDGCGDKLVRASAGKRNIRYGQDCFKCSKCQTQYVRNWDGDNWQYCNVQISSKDPKCCKCQGKLTLLSRNSLDNFDQYKCDKCGQKYNRYLTGDFWDYAK